MTAICLCNNCGAEMTPGSADGHCLKCLFTLGLSDSSSHHEKSDPPDLIEGRKVRYFGDYELIEVVGRGGMGIVFRARQVRLNRWVALKMIRSAHLASPISVERFRLEAEAAAKLAHPNIVPIYEVGEQEEQYYFTMRFIEGGRNLSHAIQERSLGVRESAELILSVAQAVNHAHRCGILHRDIKPQNILLDPQGYPYLTDFGLAKSLSENNDLTRSRDVLGTPNYMAPEQVAGKPNAITTASDIYSLGAVLFEMATGRPPFEGGSALEILKKVVEIEPEAPWKLNSAVDHDIGIIILKCLEKNPKDRYTTADDLSKDLERWLAGEPISARAVSRVEKVFKWARRKPASAALAGVSVLALIALTGMALAIPAYEKAEKARKSMLVEMAAKNAALGRAEILNYFQRVNWAERDWLDNNVASAEELLQKCPPQSRGWEWKYLKSLCGAHLLSISGSNKVLKIQFSDAEKRLSVLREGNRLETLDSKTGMLLDSLETPSQAATFALVPSSGERVLVGTKFHAWRTAVDNSMHPQSLPALSLELRQKILSGWATTDISENGQIGVWAGTSAGCVVVDLAKGMITSIPETTWEPSRPLTVSYPLPLVAQGFLTSALSSDGQSLALAFDVFDPENWRADYRLAVWDSGPARNRFTISTRSPTKAIAFAHQTNLIASAHQDGSICLWNNKDGTLMTRLYGHGAEVLTLAFSPDDQLLASGSGDKSTKVWSVARGEEIRTYRGHRGPVTSLTFNLDGTRLVSGSEDGAIKWWDLKDVQQAWKLSETGPIQWNSCGGISLSADGELTALLYKGGIRVLETHGGKSVYHIPCTGCRAVCFSPDNKYLATVKRRQIEFWDQNDGHKIRTLKNDDAPIRGVTFSPKGDFVAACSPKGVQVWDLATGTTTEKIDLGIEEVTDVKFSPDGAFLAVSGGAWKKEDFIASDFGKTPGRVILWNLKEHRIEREFSGTAYQTWKVAFSPDGKLLATATGSSRNSSAYHYAIGGRPLYWKSNPEFVPKMIGQGELLVWELRTGREVAHWQSSDNAVFALSFTPDGKRLVAAMDAGRWQNSTLLNFWDIESSQKMFALKGPEGTVDDLCFSNDGRHLACISEFGVAMVWPTKE